MRNRLLEIVAFLIDFIRDSQEQPLVNEDISMALHELGYTDIEISTAYNWFVDRFNNNSDEYYANFPVKTGSVRILTDSERSLLTVEASDFLLKMYNSSIVDTEMVENLLDRIHLFSGEQITLDEMKVLLSSILFKEFESFGELSTYDITEEDPEHVH